MIKHYLKIAWRNLMKYKMLARTYIGIGGVTTLTIAFRIIRIARVNPAKE